jgi:uncharacterized membrane protein YgdD (TMEM256/DUF423 family)
VTDRRGYGAVTPLGGIAFVIGWTLLLVALVRALSVVVP